MSKSGFYKWCKPKVKNKELSIQKEAILKVYLASRENYGRRRVYQTLKIQGIKVGKNKVAKLMKQMGLYGFGKPKFVITTKPSKKPAFPNLIKDIEINSANKVWVSDITYIPTKEGWLYLCSILDSFSRKVVGWSMSSNMKAELVLQALDMAFTARDIVETIFHSDQGSQYGSSKVRRALRKKGIRQSMTTKLGKCFENSQAESFFSLLKKELIHRCDFKTRKDAEAAIFEYIEVFYNRARIHSSLGYLSPMVYEETNK